MPALWRATPRRCRASATRITVDRRTPAPGRCLSIPASPSRRARAASTSSSGWRRSRPTSSAVYGAKSAGTWAPSKRSSIQLSTAASVGVVERRLRDAGDAARYSRPPGTARKRATEPASGGHAARRAGAVGEMAALAVERVVERGAADRRRAGARPGQREQRAPRERRPPHDLVATPSTIATEQCTARLFVPKHQSRSLFFDV